MILDIPSFAFSFVSSKTSVTQIVNSCVHFFEGSSEGLEAALYDKERAGAPPKITGEVEAHLIALACSEPPEGQACWTVRLLAERLVELEVLASISHVAVWDKLKKMNFNLGE